MSSRSRSIMPPSQIARSTRSTSRPKSTIRRLSMDRDSLQMYPPMPASALKRIPKTPNQHNGSHIIEIPASCPKQRAPVDDKKWIQSQTNQIIDYLATTNGLGAEFVKSRSFKSITTKQFISLVSHFFRIACGNRFKIGDNHVDDILTCLTLLQYPYQINKSWLKTLTAPHSLNNVIVLLGWLLTFVVSSSDLEHFESFLKDVDNTFNGQADVVEAVFTPETESKLLQLQYSGQCREEAAFKAELLDQITMQSDIGFQTFDAVAKEIVALDNKIKELTEKMPISQNQETLNSCEKDLVILEQKYESLHQQINEKSSQKQKLRQLCSEEKFHKLKSSVEKLEKSVESQTLNAAQRTEKLANLTKVSTKISAKKSILGEISSENMIKTVIVARLYQQRAKLFEDYNHNIEKLEQLAALRDDDKNVSLMCLNTSECSEFHAILTKCRGFLDYCKQKYPSLEELRDQIDLHEKELSLASYDLNELLAKEVANWSDKCNKRSEEVKAVELELLQMKRKNENEIKAITINYKDLLASNKMDESHLLEKKQRAQQLQQLFEKNTEKNNERLESMCREKNHYINSLEHLLENMEENLNRIKIMLED